MSKHNLLQYLELDAGKDKRDRIHRRPARYRFHLLNRFLGFLMHGLCLQAECDNRDWLIKTDGDVTGSNLE
uniref:Uncharacterized protein n=1 Tax=Tanacetum cinerariifolium TaxID=118510 RepID=A0A6L2N8I3_TANCI|nr:hypothetical protein [Tanacetum cinerariifolium]